MPIRAMIVIKRSDHLPAFTAEITPTRIPKSIQMIAAPIESENVAASPSLICVFTFVWFVYETSFPVNAFSIIFAYCV